MKNRGYASKKPTRVDASAKVSETSGRVWRVQVVAAAANAKVELKDATTDTGDPMVETEALANYSATDSYVDVGGVPFTTGLYVKITGASAVVYVWFSEEGE